MDICALRSPAQFRSHMEKIFPSLGCRCFTTCNSFIKRNAYHAFFSQVRFCAQSEWAKDCSVLYFLSLRPLRPLNIIHRTRKNLDRWAHHPRTSCSSHLLAESLSSAATANATGHLALADTNAKALLTHTLQASNWPHRMGENGARPPRPPMPRDLSSRSTPRPPPPPPLLLLRLLPPPLPPARLPPPLVGPLPPLPLAGAALLEDFQLRLAENCTDGQYILSLSFSSSKITIPTTTTTTTTTTTKGGRVAAILIEE